VVIGSSIAGLLAAQVLRQAFGVTIIDRDRLPETAEFRSGVPQARHPHTLLRRGQLILERHFPGIDRRTDRPGCHWRSKPNGNWPTIGWGNGRAPGRHEDTLAIACSRPLLESSIYRRVAAQPGIRSSPPTRQPA
jgi:hypothetical protein